ncbi:MAG: NAD-dependent succinate-semialdehyde dehydrogenase [Spirochaetia bacterium]|nr:NAD-dependent succinate-semialdehyde dehydrogenase [Spirochaetia bacterium]
MKSINPKNNKIIFETSNYSSENIKNILKESWDSYQNWKTISIDKRLEFLYTVAELLKAKAEILGKLMTDEMGKPIAQGIAEAEKCAWVCEYYAENGQNFLNDITIESNYKKSMVHFEPLGIILGIMPWNFPFWQVFRFAIPTILAGNAVILKHSPNVSMCALEIEKLFHEAKFPINIFRTIIADIYEIPAIIEDERIQGISLTGSTMAGKKVAETAGKNLKKTLLELGGSDPYIIFEDADIEKSVESCVTSRLINTGQSCIAAKRFIVHEKIYKTFLELFVEKMKSKKYGDPLDKENDLGPLAREDLRDEIHRLVTESKSKGADVLLGGKIVPEAGFYYPPTIVTNAYPGIPVWDEETFGPVAAIAKFNTEDEAVELANNSLFGLGAAIFSNDEEKALNIALNKINTGNVFINDFVKSNPMFPFGGIKNSGYGRELSLFGAREFTNIKTIALK